MRKTFCCLCNFTTYMYIKHCSSFLWMMNIVLLISELTICYIQIKCWYSIRLRISLTFFTYLIILHSCIEAASWLTMLSLVCSTIKVTGCKSFQLLPMLKVDDLSDWYRHHAISLAVGGAPLWGWFLNTGFQCYPYSIFWFSLHINFFGF